jgi:hypothetical protein
MNWKPVETAPKAMHVLVAWGSNTSGPEGCEIAENLNGHWIDKHGDRIETDGYRVIAWQELPPLPSKEIKK